MKGCRHDDLFDPSLIDEMLSLSPAQRIIRNDQALELVLALERAGRRLHDGEPRAAEAPHPGSR